MKNLKRVYMVIAAAILLLSACTDTKQQEKDALNEVIKIHDEAMAKSEEAIKNKILLDSLGKVTTTVDTTKASVVKNNLSTADKAMEDWMHQFNADYTGKAHEEIMQYLAEQKKKVGQVNNHLANAVKQSNEFLETIKK